MSALLRGLLDVVDSFRIDSATTFTLHGRRYESQPSAQEASESILCAEAEKRLARLLYLSLHCRLPLQPAGPGRFADWIGAGDFTQRLSGANHGTGTWQHGWVVRGVEADGRVIAEKHGIRFWVPAALCRAANTEAGSPCVVRVPEEHRQWLQSFYLVLGDADDVCEVEPLVRVYWHVRSSGAEMLTRAVTTVLNDAGIPFQFKLLNDPFTYHRADAAVLYLPRSLYGRASPPIASILDTVRPHMESKISAYAKCLAPGLALAEDPGDGSSFGLHRSGLLAAALASPSGTRARSASGRCDLVLDSLRRAGLDPEALHLNPGSTDHYDPLDVGNDRGF